jgi:hypothetical protein
MIVYFDDIDVKESERYVPNIPRNSARSTGKRARTG